MLYSTLYFSLGLGSTAFAATCTRDALKAASDSLLAAQIAGDPSLLKPVSSSVAYTENQKTASLTGGILKTALKIDHNRTSIDTTQCATFTEIIAANNPKAYVIGTALHFTDDGSSITRVDTLTTSNGDWLFNATGTLYWASREEWATIPADKRDSRAVIQAAADAYCDIFSNKSVKVPWGTPCARLEGGSYTGKGSPTDSCNVGIPSGVSLTNRKYIIDETVGEVDVMMSFAGIPDSHEFRVENGKLRFVHTMTVMTAKGGKRSESEDIDDE
jgi:hypothetical protein